MKVKEEVQSYYNILQTCTVISEHLDRLMLAIDQGDIDDNLDQIILDVQKDRNLYCIEADREKFFSTLDLLIRTLNYTN